MIVVTVNPQGQEAGKNPCFREVKAEKNMLQDPDFTRSRLLL